MEERKLYLVESARGVELIGDAGALSPQGATVQVTNFRTGERVETTAQSDGSVRVVVPGTLQDEYEVTVCNGTCEGLDVNALECVELTRRARLRRRELLDGGTRAARAMLTAPWPPPG